MDGSEIKEEVEHFGDIKVKLEENSSSVVYDVEVTSKVDIKTKEEDSPQSPYTSVTKEEIQSVFYINVNPDQDPPSYNVKLEPEPKDSSHRESKLVIGSDSKKQHPRQIQQSLQASKTRRNKSKPKRGKASETTVNRHLLQCSSCPESFPRVGRLIAHTRNKHATITNRSSDPISDDEDETPSQCPLCLKILASIDCLHTHFLRLHITNKIFQCDICLESNNEIKKFSTEAFLKRHIEDVHDPARFKFQCDICSLKFTRLATYVMHKKIHVEKKYKCKYCFKAYRVKEQMLRHIISVHKEYTDRHETFKCEECEQLFCSKKDLDKHNLQTHVEDTVQCKICSKKFLNERVLGKHLENSHRENRTWLECDVCSKVFKNNQKLVEHLEVEHKRFFKCRKCFRSFVSEEDFDGHSSKILDRSQLQCKICHVFLNTECSFTTHKETHLNPSEVERKIITQLDPNDPQDCLMKCDFCPKTFVKKSLFLDHATKCHPNQKWKCKSCEKSFQVKFQLNKHELLHSTKKLFECQVCHKGFPNLVCLKQHEGIHKIDKKYKCPKCEKSFADSNGLTLHTANHHGGAKPFKCDICTKAFVFKTHLVGHSLVHTNTRPFSCSKCSYNFKSARQLRRHQQRMHSNDTISRYKKPTCHLTRLGPHLKYFEDVVYVCCLKECDFETKDEKEVAIHNAMHE